MTQTLALTYVVIVNRKSRNLTQNTHKRKKTKHAVITVLNGKRTCVWGGGRGKRLCVCAGERVCVGGEGVCVSECVFVCVCFCVNIST